MWNTPWGVPHSHQVMAPGIVFYSTASHGGVHLSNKRIGMLPTCIKPEHNWLRDFRWWEEDCDAAVILLVFCEDLVKSGHIERPQEIEWTFESMAAYKPELLKALVDSGAIEYARNYINY